ncbi:MAG: peptidoglycan-binding domain-containing protein [Gemmatimonadota bacterium]
MAGGSAVAEAQPVSTPTASIRRVLRRGDRGPAVEELHYALGVAGPGDPGYGTFGPKTEAAVKRFQASHGLSADAVVGAKTWAAITG